MRKFSLLFLLFGFSFLAKAQITFQKVYGGFRNGSASSLHQTSDSGYIMSGCIGIWPQKNFIIKTDQYGDTLWTRTFIDSVGPYNHVSQQTLDGGYILAGAGNGDFGFDAYLIKLDVNGDTLWAKSYTDSLSPNLDFFAIQQSMDSGFIITGDYTNGGNENDLLLLKTNSNGDIIWAKTFGEGYIDMGYSVKQLSDSGYIAVGTFYGAGGQNVCVVKVSENGNLEWSRTYGSQNDEYGYSIDETSDGGSIITTLPGNGLLKIDSAGNMEWNREFWIGFSASACSVKETYDHGFIVSGEDNQVGSNLFLLKTDSLGMPVWTNTYYQGTYFINNIWNNFLVQTNDSGLIVTGRHSNPAGDSVNVFLIKTDSLGNSNCNQGSTTTTNVLYAYQSITTAIISGPAFINVGHPYISIGHVPETYSVCQPVSLEELIRNSNSFVIAPNPASSDITIHSKSLKNAACLSIFNLLGEKIYTNEKTNEVLTIKCSQFPSGIYFVKLQTENGSTVQKLIIE